MKLYYKDGITVQAITATDEAYYKRMGYKEVVGEASVKTTSKQAEPATIEQIYALCEKAGINPDDLKLEGEHPTLAEAKAAIADAKKAGK